MAEGEHLTIDVDLDADQARVHLVGELDLAAASSVTDQLVALAGRGVQSVVVDAAGLQFLDSSGLQALLSAREALTNSGVKFTLQNVTPVVERVLDITGTTDLFMS